MSLRSKQQAAENERNNMRFQDYTQLQVWQRSMDLVEEVYQLVKLLPKEELYDLSSQMRRAAVSVPSNIAEGFGRYSDNEMVRFLNIAGGSIAELETQVLIVNRLHLLTAEQTKSVFNLCKEVGRLNNALIRHIKAESKINN